MKFVFHDKRISLNCFCREFVFAAQRTLDRTKDWNCVLIYGCELRNDRSNEGSVAVFQKGKKVFRNFEGRGLFVEAELIRSEVDYAAPSNLQKVARD